MKEGAPNHTEPSAAEGVVERQYHDVVTRCRALIDVLPEAETLEYRDRVADTPELRVMARIELVRDALLSEADARAEQGEIYAERAARMLVQLKEAERTITGVYLDAVQDSADLASLMKEMFPWVEERLTVANEERYDVGTADEREAA